MPNKEAFQGVRRDFLLAQMDSYSTGREQQCESEVLTDIVRRFIRRFPLDKPDGWEPTEAELADIDDESPEAEAEEPDERRMSPEEYKAAVEGRKARNAARTSLREKIKRWLYYRYCKEHGAPGCKDDSDPFHLLKQYLSGKEIQKPRMKTPVNLWRKEKENYDAIEEQLQKMSPPVETKNLAKTRDMIARDLYAKVDSTEQLRWKDAARKEHAAAMEAYEKEMKAEVLTTPEARQRAINALIGLMQPIMDAACEAAGWKGSLIMGGPEPAREGVLSTISIHSGFLPGTKHNFGQAERLRYKTIFVPMFGTFLKKCYSATKCKSRALPKDSDLMPISMSNEVGDSFDDIGNLNTAGNRQTPDAITSHGRTLSFNSNGEADNVFPYTVNTNSSPSPPPSPTLSPSQDPSPPPSPALSLTRHPSPAALEYPRNYNPGTEVNNAASSKTSASSIPDPKETVAASRPSAATEVNAEPPTRPQQGPQQAESANKNSKRRKRKEDVNQLHTAKAKRAKTNAGRAKNTVPASTAHISRAAASKGGPLPLPDANGPVATSSNESPADPDPQIALPRSSHPSVSVANAGPKVPSAQPANPVRGRNVKGGKPKGNQKRSAKATSTKAVAQTGNSKQQPESSALSKQGNINSQPTRRSTRTAPTSETNTPKENSIVVVDESQVLLRSGKPAKKSRFWAYAEASDNEEAASTKQQKKD